MKLEIIDKKSEPLLNRENITANAEFDTITPSRKEIRNNLSAILGVKEEVISVNKIKNIYGKKKAIINAHKYSNTEDLKRIELNKFVRLCTGEGKKKKGEAKKEEKKDKQK